MRGGGLGGQRRDLRALWALWAGREGQGGAEDDASLALPGQMRAPARARQGAQPREAQPRPANDTGRPPIGSPAKTSPLATAAEGLGKASLNKGCCLTGTFRACGTWKHSLLDLDIDLELLSNPRHPTGESAVFATLLAQRNDQLFNPTHLSHLACSLACVLRVCECVLADDTRHRGDPRCAAACPSGPGLTRDVPAVTVTTTRWRSPS